MTSNIKFKALVPMKGHSERVPNKNLRLFMDKPLCYYVINSLLESFYIDKVYVNTESQPIKDKINQLFGERVKIIDRPLAIQGDFVTMNTIIDYDLSQLDGEYFLQTHSTNPLLRVETINKVIKTFLNNQNNYDSLFTVDRIQGRLYRENLIPVNHDLMEMLRTQDLPPIFMENSNLYIFTRSSFNKKKCRIGNNPMLFETPKLESIDIDIEEDFILAELLGSSKGLYV
ncbi:MAG: acylneuraminate cytidylyltransferase [Gammaproteobacteria bacterium RIFCSPHIGHO2_12_FULL_38_11]|nr:MAG: acylneuraminate cytidylyltransferase [Gammaproteobacteria bacterium RIFCSPHIGHO2_12_FULL_38_11]